MKTLLPLFLFLTITANLLMAEPPESIATFQEALQVAAAKRDKAALLMFFNFTGINETTKKEIERDIEEIIGSRTIDVSVRELDKQNQELAREKPSGVNGRPELLVSFVPTNDRHIHHFIAGQTPEGRLILLANREK